MQKARGVALPALQQGLNRKKVATQQMSTRAEYMMLPSHLGMTFSQYLKERDEILRHKWLESEKTGRDIGFEAALSGWIGQHREAWLKAQPRLQPGADV